MKKAESSKKETPIIVSRPRDERFEADETRELEKPKNNEYQQSPIVILGILCITVVIVILAVAIFYGVQNEKGPAVAVTTEVAATSETAVETPTGEQVQ